VVAGRVVAAIRRVGATGSFRANLHHGGRAEALEPAAPLADLAIRAAAAFELSVAGVDLIEGEDGPLLTEVNSSPGLEGIEDATKVDVAGEIADAALALSAPGSRR
jgi:ribosomal protein S6--L-glutamate ligase